VNESTKKRQKLGGIIGAGVVIAALVVAFYPRSQDNVAPASGRLALKVEGEGYELRGALSLTNPNGGSAIAVNLDRTGTATAPVGSYNVSAQPGFQLLRVTDTPPKDVTARALKLTFSPQPATVGANETTWLTLSVQLAEEQGPQIETVAAAEKPAPAPRPIKLSCQACRDANCKEEMEFCDGKAGARCLPLRTCLERSDCSRKNALSCLCGDKGPTECLSGGAPRDAACAREIYTATECGSGDAPCAAARLFSTRYPAGLVFRLVECEREFCAAECELTP
jgi:hypothetical protein